MAGRRAWTGVRGRLRWTGLRTNDGGGNEAFVPAVPGGPLNLCLDRVQGQIPAAGKAALHTKARMALIDSLARPLANLRLSVTDRCNLRCSYCMPEESYAWLPKRDILTFEEIDALVDVFLSLGVTRLRLTGGEPLLRNELPELVRRLAPKPALGDLALTTNGVLLAELAQPLADAGLRRLTISLDTLRAETFRQLTRRDDLQRVLRGIDAATHSLPSELKLDCVVMRGVNDDEIDALLDFARERAAEIRFIEYMDVGGATAWSMERVVSQAEMLERLRARHGPIEELRADADAGSAPAQRFRLATGQVFGIIASTTRPFCSACDRARLTADGLWYTCLYAQQGLNLRDPLRAGESPADLAERIRAVWLRRVDRGAMERLAQHERGPALDRSRLRQDPHLEMHTKGG